MVRPALRSRSLRKIFTKLPGGKTTVKYESRKPKRGSCSVTGQPLKGVARPAPSKARSLTKSAKRPSRPFGGHLSSQAARTIHKSKARK